MALLRALTDVDVPGAESERPRHRLLLVLEGRARQVEVHLVLAGLLLLGRKKSDPEPGVIARQERDAVVGVVGHLPAQDAGPEARETERVVRIEAERDEVRSHPLRISDLSGWIGTADADDLAAEWHQRDRNHLEIRYTQRDTDDRQTQ